MTGLDPTGALVDRAAAEDARPGAGVGAEEARRSGRERVRAAVLAHYSTETTR